MKQSKPRSVKREEGLDLPAIYSPLLGIRNKFSDRQPNRFFTTLIKLVGFEQNRHSYF